MAKIEFFKLVERIQTGTITEAELKRSFIAAPGRRPFDIKSVVNPETVDLTNVERLADSGDLLLRDLSTAVQKSRIAQLHEAAPTKWILAEGDSWFKLPAVMPRTLVDFLQEKHPIINIAKWGDTLANMIASGEFWPYIHQQNIDTLMFSAGGNDILGGDELWRFINLFDPAHTKPSDAPYYVNQAFFDNLEDIIAQVEGLIEAVVKKAPHVRILHHGYDYAIPDQDGPWLGQALVRQGLFPQLHGPLCNAIVRHMLDALNMRLAMLEMKHRDNYRHVDLRKTVQAGQWFDELHVKEVAARKLANKYGAHLKKLPQPAPNALVAARAAPLLPRAA